MSQRVAAKKPMPRQNPSLLSRPEVRIALIAAIVLLVAAVGLAVRARLMIAPPTETSYESQGQTHIPDGSQHPAYNSNPPTSGWHYSSPAPWGVYNQQINDEVIIHNLEHGGIWISYRDKNDTGLIQQLSTLASRYPDHVIMSYRPENDRAIAVAAWGHLLTMDAVDENRIFEFISKNIYNGPECSQGRCP